MKDIYEVVSQKEQERNELSKKIQALYVAIALLDDGPKDPTPKVKSPTPIYYDAESVKDRVAAKTSPQTDLMASDTFPAAEPNHAVEIQKQHISDLRVLIDKGESREKVLLDLVKMVMEEKFFRPTITGPRSENRTTPSIPPEHLSDVEAFDDKADQEQSRAEGETQQKLQAELDDLLTEHKEAHQE